MPTPVILVNDPAARSAFTIVPLAMSVELTVPSAISLVPTAPAAIFPAAIVSVAISAETIVPFVISADSIVWPNLVTVADRAVSETLPAVAIVASFVSTIAADAFMSALRIVPSTISVESTTLVADTRFQAVRVSETIASVIELAGKDNVPLESVKPPPNMPVPFILRLPVCWVPGVEACNCT